MKTNFYLKNLQKSIAAILAFIVFMLGLSSCTKDGSVDTQNSFLLVTNAAEASVAQDFYSDSTRLATSLAYGSSSAFLPTPSGSHLGRFRNSGTTIVNASFNMILGGAESYNVFYIDGGSYAIFPNDRSAPQSGKARVRFINLSTALTTNINLVASGGAVLASNLAFKSASDFTDIDPSTSFTVNATGSATSILSIPATFQAGHGYTVYISGATPLTITSHIITER
jgi:hypothetical protein